MIRLLLNFGVRLRTTARRQDNIIGVGMSEYRVAGTARAGRRRTGQERSRRRRWVARHDGVPRVCAPGRRCEGRDAGRDQPAGYCVHRSSAHRPAQSATESLDCAPRGCTGDRRAGHSARRPCGTAPRTRILTMRCRRRARGSIGYLARSLSRPVDGFPMLSRPLAPELRR